MGTRTPRTPKLVNGRGTIPIDKIFGDIGRIRCPSGTTDPDIYRQIKVMLNDLYNQNNFDTLEAIQKKQVTPQYVLNQTKKKGIRSVVSGDYSKPIIATIEDWLHRTTDIKPVTKKSYGGQLKSFKQVVNSKDKMDVLLQRLEQYRTKKQKEKFHGTFNKTKAMLQSFVKSEYGDSSDLLIKLRAIKDLPKNLPSKEQALEVQDVCELIGFLPPTVDNMVWSMCLSGLRPDEYYERQEQDWSVHTNYIRLEKHNPGKGNKGYSRTTLLPFPDRIVKPSIQTRQFTRYLNKAEKHIKNLGRLKNISHKTFRSTFSVWCEFAGIPQSRINVYMGHTATNTPQLYKKYQVSRYLDEDNRLLKEYVQKFETVKSNPKAREFFDFSPKKHK